MIFTAHCSCIPIYYYKSSLLRVLRVLKVVSFLMWDWWIDGVLPDCPVISSHHQEYSMVWARDCHQKTFICHYGNQENLVWRLKSEAMKDKTHTSQILHKSFTKHHLWEDHRHQQKNTWREGIIMYHVLLLSLIVAHRDWMFERKNSAILEKIKRFKDSGKSYHNKWKGVSTPINLFLLQTKRPCLMTFSKERIWVEISYYLIMIGCCF